MKIRLWLEYEADKGSHTVAHMDLELPAVPRVGEIINVDPECSDSKVIVVEVEHVRGSYLWDVALTVTEHEEFEWDSFDEMGWKL